MTPPRLAALRAAAATAPRVRVESCVLVELLDEVEALRAFISHAAGSLELAGSDIYALAHLHERLVDVATNREGVRT